MKWRIEIGNVSNNLTIELTIQQPKATNPIYERQLLTGIQKDLFMWLKISIFLPLVDNKAMSVCHIENHTLKEEPTVVHQRTPTHIIRGNKNTQCLVTSSILKVKCDP